MSVTMKFSGSVVTALIWSRRACCAGVRNATGVSTPVQVFTAVAICVVVSPAVGKPGAGRPVAPPGREPPGTAPQTAS